MRVFIAWAGERSHAAASVLEDWLPFAMQNVNTFMPSREIFPPTIWRDDVYSELSAARFGLVCVTRRNKSSPWLAFQAGAMAKAASRRRVMLVTVDLDATGSIGPPLYQFMEKPLNRAGIAQVAARIYGASDAVLDEPDLTVAMDASWSRFDQLLYESAIDSEDAETMAASAPGFAPGWSIDQGGYVDPVFPLKTYLERWIQHESIDAVVSLPLAGGDGVVIKSKQPIASRHERRMRIMFEGQAKISRISEEVLIARSSNTYHDPPMTP